MQTVRCKGHCRVGFCLVLTEKSATATHQLNTCLSRLSDRSTVLIAFFVFLCVCYPLNQGASPCPPQIELPHQAASASCAAHWHSRCPAQQTAPTNTIQHSTPCWQHHAGTTARQHAVAGPHTHNCSWGPGYLVHRCCHNPALTCSAQQSLYQQLKRPTHSAPLLPP